jgi:hypothetical protein
MMSYGDPSTQKWALHEDDSEPIVRHAADNSPRLTQELSGRHLDRSTKYCSATAGAN